MKEKRLILRSALVAAALTLGTTGSTAQTASDAVDLEVWYMSGFTAGAQQHQHPAFRLNNNGVAVDAFDVEVTLNDEPAFTEHVALDEPLASGAWTDITLQGTVTLPFAQTTTVGVKVVAEGDVNESNNSAQTTVTMPVCWTILTPGTPPRHSRTSISPISGDSAGSGTITTKPSA